MERLQRIVTKLASNKIELGRFEIGDFFQQPSPKLNVGCGGFFLFRGRKITSLDLEVYAFVACRFFQIGDVDLHSTGKYDFQGGGPGLGLAIVRGIVKAHHGFVWAESTGYDEVKMPGSTFHIVLPRRQKLHDQTVRFDLPPSVINGVKGRFKSI